MSLSVSFSPTMTFAGKTPKKNQVIAPLKASETSDPRALYRKLRIIFHSPVRHRGQQRMGSIFQNIMGGSLDGLSNRTLHGLQPQVPILSKDGSSGPFFRRTLSDIQILPYGKLIIPTETIDRLKTWGAIQAFRTKPFKFNSETINSLGEALRMPHEDLHAQLGEVHQLRHSKKTKPGTEVTESA